MRQLVWRRSVTRYVIPALPDGWKTASAFIYREPVEWLLHAVVMSNIHRSSSFRLSALVQLLPKPAAGVAGPLLHQLGRHTPYPSFNTAETVEAAEPIMRGVLELTITEALPYFASVPDLAAYTAALTELAERSPINPRYHEDLFYARLAAGDQAGALQAAAEVERTTRASTPAWVPELRVHIGALAELARDDPAAARDALYNQAATTRTTLGIPQPTTAK